MELHQWGSRGCTTFVGPDDIDEYKEINYLILQACKYYEKVDSEHWVSPLLESLKKNERIPLTTSEGDSFLEPATTSMMSHYECIDYMIDFGTTKMTYMEDIWDRSKKTTKTTKSNVNMKSTMEAIRGSVAGPDRSKL